MNKKIKTIEYGEIKCPKCGQLFAFNEWLIVGAVHVMFDCKGPSDTFEIREIRETVNMKEINEKDAIVVDDSQGEEE